MDSSVINLDSSDNNLESDSNTYAKSTPKKRDIIPIYKQNFNEHWLQNVELKDWCKKPDDPLKALCRYCDIIIHLVPQKNVIFYVTSKQKSMSRMLQQQKSQLK